MTVKKRSVPMGGFGYRGKSLIPNIPTSVDLAPNGHFTKVFGIAEELKTEAFTLREGEWNLLLDGKIVPATFNSKGAALAAVVVERKRRAKKAAR